MKLPSLAILAHLALVSCNADFPRDPEGTLDHVRLERSFRVGLVAPLARDTREAKVDALLARISAASGASPSVEQGDAEPLLTRLEDGGLDLVIGRFDKDTPWSSLVTFGPPLRSERQGKAELQLVPVMKNGENAWIALVEKAARDAAPEAQ